MLELLKVKPLLINYFSSSIPKNANKTIEIV